MPSLGSAKRSNRPLSPGSSNSNSSDTRSPSGRNPRKRQRSRSLNRDEFWFNHEEDPEISEIDGIPAPKKPKKVQYVPLTCVRPPPLAFPKSLYENAPSMPRYAESDILQDILVGGLQVLVMLVQIANLSDRFRRMATVMPNQARKGTFSSTLTWKTSASIGHTYQAVVTGKSVRRNRLSRMSLFRYMRSMSGGAIPSTSTAYYAIIASEDTSKRSRSRSCQLEVTERQTVPRSGLRFGSNLLEARSQISGTAWGRRHLNT